MVMYTMYVLHLSKIINYLQIIYTYNTLPFIYLYIYLYTASSDIHVLRVHVYKWRRDNYFTNIIRKLKHYTALYKRLKGMNFESNLYVIFLVTIM